MQLRRWLTLFLASMLIGGTVFARYPHDQAVTFGDFSYVRYIAASSRRVYFATTGGILRYNIFDREWDDPLPNDPVVDFEEVSRIWVNEFDDRLYVAANGAYYEYDMTLEAWYVISEIPEQNSLTRHIAPPDHILPPPGYNYSADGEVIDPWGRYFAVSDVLDDGTGYLWLGTWGLGAAAADASSRFMEMLGFGLIQSEVGTIYDDNGKLWLGGPVGNQPRTGLTAFDPDEQTFHYIETGVDAEFPLVDIHCIDGDSASLYVGTSEGVYVINRSDERVQRRILKRHGLISDYILSLEVTDRAVYIGTEEGLAVLVDRSDSLGLIRPNQFDGQRIWAIEEVDGQIWIGSGKGAFRYTPGSGRLQRFSDPEQVLFGDVYDIERWENTLWFVSDAGLVALDLKTAESRSFHEPLQRILPRALAVNDTIAAVASDKGLTILFHANAKTFTRDFTTDDGLASNNVYALLMDGDYIWVGTDRGITRFLWNNPDRVD